MKNFLAERIYQIITYLQTLDNALNKPFKNYLRTKINDYIQNTMERNQQGNFVKPKL